MDCFRSSIPPQYLGNNNEHQGDCGDVVIVVPNLETERMVGRRTADEHTIYIESEMDMDTISPKTITESSSKCEIVLSIL